DEVLARDDRNWKPWVVGGSALVAALAISVAVYGLIMSKGGPAPGGSGATAAAVPAHTPAPKVERARADVVMADLKPGEDGGSTGAVLPFALQPQGVLQLTAR